jgi:hypothetical protein
VDLGWVMADYLKAKLVTKVVVVSKLLGSCNGIVS